MGARDGFTLPAIDAAIRTARDSAIRPFEENSIIDGRPEKLYVMVTSPRALDDLAAPMTARERSYWNRHIERYNRRAARMGARPYAPLVGVLGRMCGVTITEGGSRDA